MLVSQTFPFHKSLDMPTGGVAINRPITRTSFIYAKKNFFIYRPIRYDQRLTIDVLMVSFLSSSIRICHPMRRYSYRRIHGSKSQFNSCWWRAFLEASRVRVVLILVARDQSRFQIRKIVLPATNTRHPLSILYVSSSGSDFDGFVPINFKIKQ
jgi:hypothetical protein